MTADPLIKLLGPTADTSTSDPTPKAHTVEVSAVTKKFIRLADLFILLDVSRSTGHRWLAANKIGPRPIRLTSASVRFDPDEVNSWLSTRRADGGLHDAKTWPPIWEVIKRRRK